MSTTISAVSRLGEIECDHDLHAFLCGLEADSSLFQPEQLRKRLIALDDLDAGFGGFDSEDSTRCADSHMRKRAKAIRTRLEAANAELYQSVRSDTVHRAGRARGRSVQRSRKMLSARFLSLLRSASDRLSFAFFGN